MGEASQRALLRPGMRRVKGSTKVWLFIVAIAVAAAALTYAAAQYAVLDLAPFDLPWWVMIAPVWLAEVTAVHLRLRKDAQSFSMSEVPLTVGLFFVDPVGLVAAEIIGSALALTINRRQPPLKLWFNVTQIAVQASLAVLAFRWVLGSSNPIGLFGWVAAVAATWSAMLAANFLINSVIRLTGGTINRDEAWNALGLSTLATAMNTNLGLVVVVVMWVAPETAWLALVPPVALALAYRAYFGQREEKTRLQSLYSVARALHESPQIESALVAAAEHARIMFASERCEIVLVPDPEGTEAFVTQVGPGTQVTVMKKVALSELASVWFTVMNRQRSILVGADPDHGIRDGAAVPIRGALSAQGAIMVANPIDDVSAFVDRDLRLLETVASQVSVALENGRLEDSLAEVTELKEELAHQATHDSLTRLANRLRFAEALEAALDTTATGANPVAVLYLDLDDFKGINDRFGHSAGDDLLVAVAARLRASCRPGDVIARLGGDEFAILIGGDASADTATEVAERILESVGAPIQVEESLVTATVSIGIAFARFGQHPDDVIRHADEAMYVAKRRKKGTYEIFVPDMAAALDRRIDIMGELGTAIENGDLEVVYQPIVNLESEAIVGAEALVRWNHPTRGYIPPEQFIPYAEDSGLIVPLGKFVLWEAVRAMRGLQRRFNNTMFMSVNLSPRQLAESDLMSEVASAIGEVGVHSSSLVLELTESMMMQTSERTLTDLEQLGVRLAIDDFGTGYSSLAYLDRLPISILKIDRAFLAGDGLAVDGEVSPLVRAVLQIGNAMGVETVAEGIETAEQLAAVRSMGCVLGQGFLFAEPMTVEQLKALPAVSTGRRAVAG